MAEFGYAAAMFNLPYNQVDNCDAGADNYSLGFSGGFDH